MDLEQITSEIFNRVMEKIKQSQAAHSEALTKKFIQSDSDTVTIPGYDSRFLADVQDSIAILEYEFLVISRLSIDEMAAAANGTAINDKTQALRQFLLNGKLVYVIEDGLEYRHYKTTANPVYYHVFRDYEKQLLQYGVRIMSQAALESGFAAEAKPVSSGIEIKESAEANNPIKNANTKVKSHYSTEEKLITHELAKQLGAESPVLLKPGTLITPSAKDVFRENKVTVTIK